MPRWDTKPEKPSEAEARAAIPAATEAARTAQSAAEAAVDAAEAVGSGAVHAAERTVVAAEAALERVTETADDLKPTSRTRLCPHCKGELIPHGDANPHKAGCYHCNACGCCFQPGLRALRPGTSGCPQAGVSA